MKMIKILVAILTFPLFMAAQSVQGEIKMSEKSKSVTTLKSGNAVDLFKQFKEGKYGISFTFKGEDLPVDEEKRGIVLFSFVTEVFKDGKKAGSYKRQPMPFFPGEMLEPVETFDVISALTYANGNPEKSKYPGHLETGKYVIVLKAIPVGAKGKIQEAQFEVQVL